MAILGKDRDLSAESIWISKQNQVHDREWSSEKFSKNFAQCQKPSYVKHWTEKIFKFI